eukprot:7718753-Heterocapsa_arctica.AAC.1
MPSPALSAEKQIDVTELMITAFINMHGESIDDMEYECHGAAPPSAASAGRRGTAGATSLAATLA